MFNHILTPLDGSQLAEAAVPVAVKLAQQLPATLTLFHVVEHNAPASIHGEPHLTTHDAAQAYLADVIARLVPAALAVAPHVHSNPTPDVAQSIVDHAEELQVDLIVMCSHGGNSLQKRLFGSIAQKIIALGITPVLLVNPEQVTAAFRCRRLLVTLDGDPDHEHGLTTAVTLAQQCQAQLHLVMVVPTLDTLSPAQSATGRLLPQATAALLDAREAGARDYLQDKCAEQAESGLTLTCEVRRGDPAATIVAAAADEDIDLIVLGTHGKLHMDAFWSGSVTPKLAAEARWPLLLAPVRDRD
ncbi:MAG: universal stress protein [Caldilineaceae bacterium]